MALARPYEGLAATWEADAGQVYRPLAESLLRASPMDLAGATVLDLGSGTGAVARAARDRGGRVVAVDLSFDMAAHGSHGSWMALVADARWLPVRDAAVDAALAGFLLNHLPPVAALAEMARAVRPGGAVLASTWSAARPDPVKAAIDGVLGSWGWEPPAWYEAMKAEVEPVSGHAHRLEEAGRLAGLVEVEAREIGVDLGIRDPRAVVAYRLAMPHIDPWRTGLGPSAEVRLTRALRTAVAPLVDGWRPAVVQLTARRDGHRR